jgi:hypothetical protein
MLQAKLSLSFWISWKTPVAVGDTETSIVPPRAGRYVSRSVAVEIRPVRRPTPRPTPPRRRRPPPTLARRTSSTVSLARSAACSRTGMVEDLHTLDKLNAHANGTTVRLIPRLFVGPDTRHELGELAARLYAERHHGRRAIRELDFRLAHALLGRAERGDGDLLSYILFDEAFLEHAIQLGIGYARRKLAAGSPWLP